MDQYHAKYAAGCYDYRHHNKQKGSDVSASKWIIPFSG